MRRVRTKVAWEPVWEGSVKGWAIKFNRRNRWRLDSINGDADLLQEAFIVFLKICRKYPRVMDPAHFMALYKRAMENQMHDRSKHTSKYRNFNIPLDCDALSICGARIGELTNGGYARALVEQAPEELKLALALIANHPEKLRIKNRKRKENLNMQLRRLLGIEGYDFMGGLKELLT